MNYIVIRSLILSISTFTRYTKYLILLFIFIFFVLTKLHIRWYATDKSTISYNHQMWHVTPNSSDTENAPRDDVQMMRFWRSCINKIIHGIIRRNYYLFKTIDIIMKMCRFLVLNTCHLHEFTEKNILYVIRGWCCGDAIVWYGNRIEIN